MKKGIFKRATIISVIITVNARTVNQQKNTIFKTTTDIGRVSLKYNKPSGTSPILSFSWFEAAINS